MIFFSYLFFLFQSEVKETILLCIFNVLSTSATFKIRTNVFKAKFLPIKAFLNLQLEKNSIDYLSDFQRNLLSFQRSPT